MENIVTLREVFSEYEWDERLGAGTVEHLTIDRENRRIAVTLRLPRYVPAAAIEAQAAFLEQSLLPWVPGFCDLLEARAKTGFYRGVAQMLRAFMEEERTWAVRSRQSRDVR